MESVQSLAGWTNQQFDPSLSWKDVDWIRSMWPGKLILKGILDPEDARSGVKAGADAIVVSNHGGRQLDGASSSISMLPAIAEAVGSQTEVWLDGGLRSGQDLARAIALGARACMIGRPYVYGLGAGGQAGVAKAIDIFKKELDTTMALMGERRIEDIGRQNLAAGVPERR
jgi:L-lactate dehydrogenase (cytochrome)